MRAVGVVFPSPRRTELEHFEVGDPGPGQLLLQCVFSSLSPGTERGLMLEGSRWPFPVRIGYSFAGRVAAVGPGVTRFKVGDPVVTTARHASYVLAAERFVTPAPENIDLEGACFFNLAHTALYGVRRARIQLGEAVVVLGQGPVGLLAAKFAQLSGAAPVVAVDLAEDRLEIGRRLGLPLTVNGADEPRLKAILADMEGGGPAAVIDATGREQATLTALDMVRERGRIVLLATYRANEAVTLHHQMTWKGAELIGAYVNSKPFSLEQANVEMPSWPPTLATGSSRYVGSELWTSDADVRLFLRLLTLGLLDVSPLISHRFRPDQAAEAYGLVLDQDRSLIGGVIDWRQG